MEIKHTPGPFEVRYPEGFMYTIVDQEGRTVATINGQHGDLETCEEHEERHLADAKLLAAAPEMLAALKDAVKLIDWLGGNMNQPRPLAMKAAIKKATE